ncbi:MAG: hydrogenase maturation protease [Cytophagales bacterium]|nr:hydrogenase maturation protease [Cytophagales bacterium]
MSSSESDILILGLGNDILADDGIGPKLVERLRLNMFNESLIFKTAAIGGMEIIALTVGFRQAIIIDGMKSGRANPGKVIHLTPENFVETLHLSSFHDLNFLTALEFARSVDMELPNRIDIIAVEILEDLTFSNDFSPEISRNFDRIYWEVRRLVERMIGN